MIVRRNAESILLFQMSMGLLGGSCLIESVTGGVPMPQETHGGAMYTIPAEVWSLVVLGVAAMISAGVVTDSLRLTLSGALLGAVVYWALFVFADYAEFGFLLSRGSGALGFLHVCIAVAASFDILRRWIENGLSDCAAKLKK